MDPVVAFPGTEWHRITVERNHIRCELFNRKTLAWLTSAQASSASPERA